MNGATEAYVILHEVAHFALAPPERRGLVEFGLGAGPDTLDRDTAERVVGLALEVNRDKIGGWLSRSGRRPNLVLDYDGDPARPVGRTLRRGESRPRPCSRALVVLRWGGDREYYVLTSYPECLQ